MTYTDMIKKVMQQTRVMWNSEDSIVAKYIRNILDQDKPLVEIKADFERESGGEIFQTEMSIDIDFEKLAYKTYLTLCLATESFDIVTLWNFSKTEWEMYGRWSRFDEAIENIKALRQFVEKAEPSSDVTEIIISIANNSLRSIMNVALGNPFLEEEAKEISVNQIKMSSMALRASA